MGDYPDRVDSDTLPGVDLAIIAVMHHVTQVEGDERVGDLRAAALLERVLEVSKHEASALIILTRLFNLVGAPGLAFKTFARLNVKSVQYDTLGFHLLTRISTLHPHSFESSDHGPERGFDDPHTALSNALQIYFRADETIPAAIKDAIERGKYYSSLGMSSLATRYHTSISKPLFMIEQRRILRLIGKHDVGQGKDDFCMYNQNLFRAPQWNSTDAPIVPDPQILSFADNRDTRIVPNFSPSMVQPFETTLSAGPQPDVSRPNSIGIID